MVQANDPSISAATITSVGLWRNGIAPEQRRIAREGPLIDVGQKIHGRSVVVGCQTVARDGDRVNVDTEGAARRCAVAVPMAFRGKAEGTRCIRTPIAVPAGDGITDDFEHSVRARRWIQEFAIDHLDLLELAIAVPTFRSTVQLQHVFTRREPRGKRIRYFAAPRQEGISRSTVDDNLK
jgi:hypothetical protein